MSDPAGRTAPAGGAGRRRRLPPEQRRRELLDVAHDVLRRLGPSACTVEDITRAAGTAKGNFYRYFPTFDDLLVAVRDDVLDRYAVGVRDRRLAGGAVDWWRALEEEADAFIDFQLSLGHLHDVLFHGPAARTRPVAPERSAPALIALLLDAGIAAGAFAPVDVAPTAALAFEVLHGAADRIAAGHDPQATRAAARHLLTAALRSPPAGPAPSPG